MEIKKEGFHTYGESILTQNTYFLSVEYPSIQHNRPGSLLPMLIREQDGKRMLLYDISNVQSLAQLSQDNKSRGNNFLVEDCRSFLLCLQGLLKDLEELMLLPEHIPFHPTCIYRGEKNDFFWMYCPNEVYDIEKEVQQFFSWMLSEINYGDSETVRYMYHVYWLMRNRSFSQNLIQECLAYQQEKTDGITSYENFFAEKTDREKMEDISWQSQYRQEKKKTEEKKTMQRYTSLTKNKKLLLFVETVLGIAVLFTGITVAASAMYSLRYGEVPVKNRYWVCCVILFVLILEGVYHLHRRRTAVDGRSEKQKPQGGRLEKSEMESCCEETVRLDAGAERKQPRLRSEDSGEIFPLQSFPYYIGNDKGLNQLTIYDNTVSRKHAVIEKRGEEYFLRDLRSTNGTWVNDIRIRQDAVQVRDGDILQFAAHVYRFTIAVENL